MLFSYKALQTYNNMIQIIIVFQGELTNKDDEKVCTLF